MAAGLSSDPSSATCLSVLNEACGANRDVPGHRGPTPHGAAGQGWRDQSWVLPARPGTHGCPWRDGMSPEEGGLLGGLPMPQPLYPHRCRTLGTLQALHTGMCSGGGWPRDGGLVPSQRPRGCGQGTQRWEDGDEGPGGRRGDGDSQVGNKASVKRTLSALISGGAPKGCVWGVSHSAAVAPGLSPSTKWEFGAP